MFTLSPLFDRQAVGGGCFCIMRYTVVQIKHADLPNIPETLIKNHQRWRCSIANTSSDHSYDFFKYKILRISRNSKDSRKGQDRIVGSALLVFAPAALRQVVIIDL